MNVPLRPCRIMLKNCPIVLCSNALELCSDNCLLCSLGERSEPPVVSNAHRRSVTLSVPWAFPEWVGSNMRH